MNFFQTDTALIIFGFLAAIAAFLDHYTSDRGPYYGTMETNSLVKNKDGSYSGLKHNIGAGILLAIGAVLHFYAGKGAYIIFYGPMIIGFTMVAIKNWNLQKKKRAEQIQFLRALREYDNPQHTEDEIAARFNRLMIARNNHTGLRRYTLFGWVLSAADTEEEAVREIQRALRTIARSPESEWFPK